MLDIQDELKARSAELHAVEESKRKLQNEKTSLEERLSRIERKNADEVKMYILFSQLYDAYIT